jgi:flagellar protein FliO/FliZ
MLDGVFGVEMPFVVKFFVAFLLVLGSIGLAAWGLRRFTSGRLGGASTRGRQPRLGVIDYASVDARRRLILVRRDNVEHLLMIGGPTDVVVEANIVRAVAAPRDVALARPAAVEPLPRAIPLPDNGNGSWPLQPEVITPPPPARSAPKIEPASDEAPAWPPLQPQADAPPAAPARQQRDTLAALADELSARPSPPSPPSRVRTQAPARAPLEARAEPRTEPRPEPRAPAPAVQAAPTPSPADTAAADQSLAEMAHRLEAALRKPNAPAEARAPAPQPRQESRPEPRQAQPAEQVMPEPPAAPPALPQPRAARPAEPKPARSAPPAKPPQSTTLYDNLEQEMASLLGRPTNKS